MTLIVPRGTSAAPSLDSDLKMLLTMCKVSKAYAEGATLDILEQGRARAFLGLDPLHENDLLFAFVL